MKKYSSSESEDLKNARNDLKRVQIEIERTSEDLVYYEDRFIKATTETAQMMFAGLIKNARDNLTEMHKIVL